jgi:hypothetical protein
MNKNEKVSDLSDIHGYVALARLVAIPFAVAVIAILIIAFTP